MQEGAKLASIDIKQQSFEIMTVYFGRISTLDIIRDVAQISDQFTHLEQALATVKQTLQKKLKGDRLKRHSNVPSSGGSVPMSSSSSVYVHTYLLANTHRHAAIHPTHP